MNSTKNESAFGFAVRYFVIHLHSCNINTLEPIVWERFSVASITIRCNNKKC